MRHLSDRGLALIRQCEGFSAVPYLDVAGLLTIGYGHRILPQEEVPFMRGIDADSALELLRVDAAISAHAVGRFITSPLTQNQFDALVSFTFNLGAGTLQRSTLRCVINRGDYADAPSQIMRFVWAGGRKVPALVRRRAAEVALYTQ